MKLSIDGKVVIVSEASRGIGATIAKSRGHHGATVIINYLKFGGSFPWENDPNVAYIGCADHLNRGVCRLERTDEAGNEEICP